MRSIMGVLLLVVMAVPAPCAAQADPADAAWRAGQTDVAARLYEQRLAADSTDGVALHRLALYHAWADRFDESLALFDRLLRVEPTNDEARVDRARVFAWRGQTAEAIELLDAVLRERPDYVHALKARAQFTSWAGEYGSALQAYDRLLTLAPDDAVARYDRARVLGWAAQYDDAARAYDELLRADPNDVAALIGLANVRVWEGATDAADTLYARVLAVDATNAEALRGRARASALGGDLRLAERRWRQALDVAPVDIEAHVGLAQTLRWQGRDAAANEVAQRALAIEPGDAGIREQLRWIDVAMRPRTAPAALYEHDSDGNRITSYRANAAARLMPRLELRADGYLRQADAVAPSPVFGHRAYGGMLTAWYQIEPGWAVSVGAGAAASDMPDARVTPAYTAGMTSPARNPMIVSFNVTHAALDETALLMQRQVSTTEAAATAAGVIGGALRARVNGSITRLRGRVSGASNTRLAAGGSLGRRIAAPLTLALQGRVFTFDRDDIFDGYFAPDFYGLAELSAQFAREHGMWSYNLEAAPGLQKVRSDGDLQGSIRAAGGLQYALRPGRAIALTAVFSNAGLQSLSPTAAGEYRYRSISLSSRWTF